MTEMTTVLDRYGTMLLAGTLAKQDAIVVDRKYIPDYKDNNIPPALIQYAMSSDHSVVVVDRQKRSVDVVYRSGSNEIKVDRFGLDDRNILPAASKDRIECALNTKELGVRRTKKKR